MPKPLQERIQYDQVMHSLILPFYGYMDQVQYFLVRFDYVLTN